MLKEAQKLFVPKCCFYVKNVTTLIHAYKNYNEKQNPNIKGWKYGVIGEAANTINSMIYGKSYCV